MPLLQDTVIDQHGRPVVGALVTVRDDQGALVELRDGAGALLANPLTTDSLGAYAATVPAGSYVLTYRKGDAVRTVEREVQGPAETPVYVTGNVITLSSVVEVATLIPTAEDTMTFIEKE